MSLYKVNDIAKAIEKIAPPELAEKWDNVGLMVGDYNADVSSVYVCLDVTNENMAKAITFGADMIVSHHPLIFKPITKINESEVTGSIIINLIKNGISVYSAHTNLDNADGGMNDILAEKLDLSDVRHFTDKENQDPFGNPFFSIGRVGKLDIPMELADFVSYAKSVLGCGTIKYVGEATDTIQKVAVCSGAGGDGIYTAFNAGADVYLTSDIRHHEAQLAYELGLNLIDAGHFETENTICEFMSEYLKETLPGITVYKSDSVSFFK